MYLTGVVRTVDELGKIVIPSEVRKTFNIEARTRMDILVEDGNIILRKFSLGCSICGDDNCNLQKFKKLMLFKKCLSKFLD